MSLRKNLVVAFLVFAFGLLTVTLIPFGVVSINICLLTWPARLSGLNGDSARRRGEPRGRQSHPRSDRSTPRGGESRPPGSGVVARPGATE